MQLEWTSASLCADLNSDLKKRDKETAKNSQKFLHHAFSAVCLCPMLHWLFANWLRKAEKKDPLHTLIVWKTI